MDLWSVNAQVIIAFSLSMIAFSLVYIAFFKESPSQKKSSRNRG